MKRPWMLIVVLSAGALCVTHSALATVNLNSSKSNIYRLDPNDPNAEKTCHNGGGKIVTRKDGQRICIMEAQASKTTVKSSQSNSSD